MWSNQCHWTILSGNTLRIDIINDLGFSASLTHTVREPTAQGTASTALNRESEPISSLSQVFNGLKARQNTSLWNTPFLNEFNKTLGESVVSGIVVFCQYSYMHNIAEEM